MQKVIFLCCFFLISLLAHAQKTVEQYEQDTISMLKALLEPEKIVRMHGKIQGYWRARDEDEKDFKHKSQFGTDRYGSIDKVFTFAGEVETKVVTFVIQDNETKPGQDCFACGVIIGCAVFEKREDEWQLIRMNRCMGKEGIEGQVGNSFLKQIGDKKYALVYEGSDPYHGGESAWESWYDVDTLETILELITSVWKVDCEKEQNCDDFTAKISVVPIPNVAYYKLRIHTKGKKYKSGNHEEKPMIIDDIKEYHYQAGKGYDLRFNKE